MNVYPMEWVLVEARRLQEQVAALRTEKAALERRIDELCAEVERLRKEKDTIHLDAFEISGMLVKAMDENAKLRELVDELCRCADAGKPCATCPLSDGEGGCLKAGRLRELGIEAGE